MPSLYVCLEAERYLNIRMFEQGKQADLYNIGHIWCMHRKKYLFFGIAWLLFLGFAYFIPWQVESGDIVEDLSPSPNSRRQNGEKLMSSAIIISLETPCLGLLFFIIL